MGQSLVRRFTLGAYASALLPRLVGLVFVAAGFLKAVDASALKRVVAFDGFPRPLVTPLLWVIICGEIVLGMAMFLNPAGRRLLWVSAAVLVVYTAQLAFLLAFVNAPSCACLGLVREYAAARQGNAVGLARNAALLGVLAWLLWYRRRHSGPGAWHPDGTTPRVPTTLDRPGA